MDEIYSLKTSKANPQNSIPANIMKENCDLFSKKLHIDFLQAIDVGIFPTKMKNADGRGGGGGGGVYSQPR